MNSVRSQIKSMLKVEPRNGGFRAFFKVSPDLSIFPDHFSYSQILPGVCLIQAVLLSGAMAMRLDDLHLVALKNAKLLQPILPGEQVQIDADTTTGPDGRITIKARITGGEKRRAEFSLTARAGVLQEADSP